MNTFNFYEPNQNLINSNSLRNNNLISSPKIIFFYEDTTFLWKELMKINTKYIEKSEDISQLEPYVENILYSKLFVDDVDLLSNEYIVQLETLTQLIGQYLVFTQKRLEVENQELREKINELNYNINESERLQKIINDLRRTNEEKDLIIKTYKNMIEEGYGKDNGVNTNILIENENINLRNRKDGLIQTERKYYYCKICKGKKFKSQRYLDEHIQRRHDNYIENDRDYEEAKDNSNKDKKYIQVFDEKLNNLRNQFENLINQNSKNYELELINKRMEILSMQIEAQNSNPKFYYRNNINQIEPSNPNIHQKPPENSNMPSKNINQSNKINDSNNKKDSITNKKNFIENESMKRIKNESNQSNIERKKVVNKITEETIKKDINININIENKDKDKQNKNNLNISDKKIDNIPQNKNINESKPISTNIIEPANQNNLLINNQKDVKKSKLFTNSGDENINENNNNIIENKNNIDININKNDDDKKYINTPNINISTNIFNNKDEDEPKIKLNTGLDIKEEKKDIDNPKISINLNNPKNSSHKIKISESEIVIDNKPNTSEIESFYNKFMKRDNDYKGYIDDYTVIKIPPSFHVDNDVIETNVDKKLPDKDSIDFKKVDNLMNEYEQKLNKYNNDNKYEKNLYKALNLESIFKKYRDYKAEKFPIRANSQSSRNIGSLSGVKVSNNIPNLSNQNITNNGNISNNNQEDEDNKEPKENKVNETNKRNYILESSVSLIQKNMDETQNMDEKQNKKVSQNVTIGYDLKNSVQGGF